jgi:hypothetical protein
LHPMHCTILIVTIFAYTIDHVEPKNGNPCGVSPMGVRRSTSVKW